MKRTCLWLILLGLLCLSACGENEAQKSNMTKEAPVTKTISDPEAQALWEGFGLGETARTALEQALARKDMVVVKDDHWINRELLDAFYENSLKGEVGQVLILSYYDMVGQRYGVKLFLEELPQSPWAFLSHLSFDGSSYHQTTRASHTREVEEGAKVSFRYLRHFEGETKPPARPLFYEEYVLTDDAEASWEKLQQGLLSSYVTDPIASFRWVASRRTVLSDSQAESLLPVAANGLYWQRLEGKEDYRAFFAGANSGRQPEGEGDTQGVLSYQVEGRILWKAALPYEIHKSFPSPEGILLFGCRDEGPENDNSIKYYLERYDTEGRRLWQYHDGGPMGWMELMAADCTEDRTICAFTEWTVEGRRQAKILALDGQGKLLWRHTADLPEGCIRAACAWGNIAYYVVQDSYLCDTAVIYQVDQQHSSAWQAPHLAELKAPEGQILVVKDIMHQMVGNVYYYVSAYFCPMPEEAGYPAGQHSEVQDVLEKVFEYAQTHESMDVPTELLTEGVQEKYTAVLYQYKVPLTSSAVYSFPAKILQKYDGAVGGRLFIDSQNQLYEGAISWEIEEIGEVKYSPATSAFSLYAPCRVIRYTYSPDEEEGAACFGEAPGSFILTDKLADFRR